jgi:DMSO/TMAO reductase YedYZ molybdopterin-dependent catalytic subunit
MSQTKPSGGPTRRSFLRLSLAAIGTSMLSACDRLSHNETFVEVLKSAQNLSRSAHKLVAGRKAMAQEFTEADIHGSFRSNGTSMPAGKKYKALLDSNFATWKLEVSGLVEKPMHFSLDELKAMPARTQITRHDCVEGWSAIAKWKGVPLHQILAMVKPLAEAQYVVFRCADPMGDYEDDDEEGDEGEESGGDEGDATAAPANASASATVPVVAAAPEAEPAPIDTTYYESIDMDDAVHAQTILAYEVNGIALPVKNGAPLRLRVERQLGYKQAKYLMKIELVSSIDNIRGGKGGYWEEQGYEWYAGI